jgi:lysophospholipase L1-like esterase
MRFFRTQQFFIGCAVAWASIIPAGAARGEHDGKVQIMLLGDSTTIGSVCRKTEPKLPQLEGVIQSLLAAEKDMPPTNVINQGRDGEFIHGLLTLGRYERDVLGHPGIDYIFIRYALNDINKREDFDNNFPKDYHELIVRLRKDFPQAELIPMTIIPYATPERDAQMNGLIKQAAEADKLPLFDVYTRYKKELVQAGPNTLNYRRFPLAKIPEAQRGWLQPFVQGDAVVVMDTRLDAHFANLPGWFADRHPGPAGYHVIGDETAKYLMQRIREKKSAAAR